MSEIKKAYLEHVALFVKDIHWHIRFFEEVLGMGLREVDGTVQEPRQYWTLGVCSSSPQRILRALRDAWLILASCATTSSPRSRPHTVLVCRNCRRAAIGCCYPTGWSWS